MTFAELYARIKALKPNGHVCLSLHANRYSGDNHQDLQWQLWVAEESKLYTANTPESLLEKLAPPRELQPQLDAVGEVVL